LTHKRSAALAAAALVGLAVAGLLVHFSARAGRRAQRALDVQPFPGTPDASPSTEIGFPALAPSSLQSVAVTGSRTGPHAGRLRPLGRHGTAFVPDRPFVDGDRVSVTAHIRRPAAGGGSGRPKLTSLRFSFRVAAAVHTGPPKPVAHEVHDVKQFTHTFRSEASLQPPIVRVSGTDPDPRSGDIFADAAYSTQTGPLILDPRGRLVYFKPLGGATAYDVKVQKYHGRSVLTYWQGNDATPSLGTDMIVSHTYQPIAEVRAGHGYRADLHEFTILPDGDALITADLPVKADLSAVGGSRDGKLLDSVIQEVNIATGQVVWEWHAYGHVPLTDSYAGKPGNSAYDFFHLNSVQLLRGDKLLVSARNTWTIYEIDMRTGRTRWRLGGKRSTFDVGPGANFEWQHDARIQTDGTLTLFDNGGGLYKSEKQSRALRLRLSYSAHTATLLSAFTNSTRLLSLTQGNVQVLPDGNTFVSWGQEPYFAEFSKSGLQLFSLHFRYPLQSYRGYRFPWWGRPTGWPPSLAASTRGGRSTVYASWNGATGIAAWQVFAGASPSALAPAGRFPDAGFETAMSVPSAGPYFAVRALDINGRVIGTSPAVRG
jgi:hypothetical protein